MGTRHKINTLPVNINKVMINGTALDAMEEVKYLRVTLDNTLTWDRHIDSLCKQISPKVELLRWIKCKLRQS